MLLISCISSLILEDPNIFVLVINVVFCVVFWKNEKKHLSKSQQNMYKYIDFLAQNLLKAAVTL